MLKSVFRHMLVLALAAIFGPLTSGYPVVLALCGSADGAPMLCRMATCEDEAPTGSAVSPSACCNPQMVVDGVSNDYVKPLQLVTVSAVAPNQELNADYDSPFAHLTFDRDGHHPAVHAPPLYLSHRALLI